MDFFKAKLVTSLLAIGLIAGALIGLLLYYVFPQFYPQGYGVILLFFLILESLIMLYVESASRRVNQRQMLNTYMLVKAVKIFIGLVFLGIYAFIVKEDIKNFVLVFIIFYLIFLAVEAFLFLKIEKRLKNKQQ